MASDKLLAEWFWTDRWTGSSAFLLPMEPRGLYREMLSQAWRRGAKLPADYEAIRRAVGCTKSEWNRCWPKIAEYWRQEGDNLINDTQMEVWLEALTAKTRASERGRKGAQATAQARAQATAQARAQGVADPPVLKHVLKHQPPSPSPVRTELKNSSVGPPKEPADPRVKEFLDWFQSEYTLRRHGAAYLVDWAKDGKLVKAMLGATDLPRLKQLAQILLSDKCDDEWIINTDRGIGILKSRFNWLSDRLAEWEAKRAVKA